MSDTASVTNIGSSRVGARGTDVNRVLQVLTEHSFCRTLRKHRVDELANITTEAMMDLEIRKAPESDLHAVLRLYGQPGMDNGRVLSVDAAAKILRRMATYPDYAVYVATANAGSVVGTFALLVMDNLAHMGTPSAVVEDVCVDEQLRGQGIGRAMMHFAMEFARQRGCYKLALSSNAVRDRAHAFYRSLGFEQHGFSFHVPLVRRVGLPQQ